MGLVASPKPAFLVGIDPGKSGGIAMIGGADGGYTAHRMPATDQDLLDLLMPLQGWAHVWIEQVHSMPKEGVSSAFKFGQNYGALRMAVVACKLPLHTVTPQKWCSGLGLRKKKGEANTTWKNRHKALAQELYPGIKITHATADALLIAHWAKLHG